MCERWWHVVNILHAACVLHFFTPRRELIRCGVSSKTLNL
jgi:hypothetical protein